MVVNSGIMMVLGWLRMIDIGLLAVAWKDLEPFGVVLSLKGRAST